MNRLFVAKRDLINRDLIPRLIAAFIALVALIICSDASAKLGETLDQCIARYGTSVESNPKTGFVIFQKEPYVIFVRFSHDVVGQIGFFRIDHQAMDDAEIKPLLETNENAAGSPFLKRVNSHVTAKIWMAKNAVATYDQQGKALIIAFFSFIADEEARPQS
jgi:hypothetical protein